MNLVRVPRSRTAVQMARHVILLLQVGLVVTAAAAAPENDLRCDELWDLDRLRQVPRTWPADEDYGAADLRAIYYEGLPLAGTPTRVFAYIGLPEGATADTPAPGVVCVHGGGGTAFAEWVRLWNARGYAAIAMDTNGTVPQGKWPDRPRHEHAGPYSLDAGFGFKQADAPLREHWNYHAVADVILANSLLRSLPEVDADRVGITGISWGGYKTCIAASLDDRFAFAAPVYGCGFLDVGSSMKPQIETYGHDRWMRYWDPGSYLPRLHTPILWVNGTNDQHYHLSSFQLSYRATKAPVTYLTVPVRMAHSHPAGWAPPEIMAFADSIVRDGKPLARFNEQGRAGEAARARYRADAACPVVSAQLHYTADDGPEPDRLWQSVTADLDAAAQRVSARVPEDARVYFFEIVDSRGLRASSPHIERAP